MKKLHLFLIASLFCGSSIWAQQNANNIQLGLEKKAQRKNIIIPDIEGFQTLKGDFHIHTVFSDGLVWPTIRVQECWTEGIDVMAITDHLEYRPHQDFMSKGHNHSYNLAVNEAQKKNIILIKASEITRQMPPGHLNALFINDADTLHQGQVDEVFKMVKNKKP